MVDDDAVDLVGHVLECIRDAFEVLEHLPRDGELQWIGTRVLEGVPQTERVNLVRLAFQADEPTGQTVKLVSVCADVPEQRHRIGRHRGSFADDTDDFLHFRTQLVQLVKVDCASRCEHFVDRVVHRADQRGDRTAIEGRKEGFPNFYKDAPDYLVGVMLAVSNGGERIARRKAVVGELAQLVGSGDQGRRMRLEHPEKVTLVGQQSLEPSEHEQPL